MVIRGFSRPPERYRSQSRQRQHERTSTGAPTWLLLVIAVFGALIAIVALNVFLKPPSARGESVSGWYNQGEVHTSFDPNQPVVIKLSKLHAGADGYITTTLGSVFFNDYRDTPIMIHYPSNRNVTVFTEPIPSGWLPGNIGTKLIVRVNSRLPGVSFQGKADLKYRKDGQWVSLVPITFQVELTGKPVGCPRTSAEAALAMGGENWQLIEEVVDVTRAFRYQGPALPMHQPDWAGAMGHIFVLNDEGEIADIVRHTDDRTEFTGEHVLFICMYDAEAWR